MLRKRLSRLSTRFYAIVALAAVLTAVLAQVLLSMAIDNAYEMRKLHLSDVTESAVSILADLQAQVDDGTISAEEAKAEGHRLLSALRYGESGYFFVFDGDGFARVHPLRPDWVDRDMSDLADPNGVKFVEEFVRIAKTEGKGTLNYHFTVPGTEATEAKHSYVVWYEPWDWIVGTGAYGEFLEAERALLRNVTLTALLVSVAILIVVSTLLTRSVIRPLNALVNRMAGMRKDDLETAVPYTDGLSEIGEMARSIDVFREALVERKRLEAEQVERDAELARQREEALKNKLEREAEQAREAEHRRAEEERQRAEREEQRVQAEAEREHRRAEQNAVVKALSDALSAMSDGDLTATINTAFPEDYESLRHDFNAAIARIADLVGSIVEGSRTIRSESQSLNNAAVEMSRRTESQAASLEETAAAITELSASVENSSNGAREAASTVTRARERSVAGKDVVERTIGAMTEISESSGKISRITSVIDDIAFQTNLLALNAGVEAARAGEAGRGFSVVASEVRALAQRSSEAAREIAELIATSGQQVENGVALVNDSGLALTEIEKMVSSLDELVSAIADSSGQQATGLSEISVAVNRLDQVTQQNAAMFEETSAAVTSLQSQAEVLEGNTASFKVAEGSARSLRMAS